MVTWQLGQNSLNSWSETPSRHFLHKICIHALHNHEGKEIINTFNKIFYQLFSIQNWLWFMLILSKVEKNYVYAYFPMILQILICRNCCNKVNPTSSCCHPPLVSQYFCHKLKPCDVITGQGLLTSNWKKNGPNRTHPLLLTPFFFKGNRQSVNAAESLHTVRDKGLIYNTNKGGHRGQIQSKCKLVSSLTTRPFTLGYSYFLEQY